MKIYEDRMRLRSSQNIAVVSQFPRECAYTMHYGRESSWIKLVLENIKLRYNIILCKL